jgi:hypothetical protein
MFYVPEELVAVAWFLPNAVVCGATNCFSACPRAGYTFSVRALTLLAGEPRYTAASALGIDAASTLNESGSTTAGIKGDPSFAIALQRPGFGPLEIRAIHHDQNAFSFIQMLVQPDDAAEALRQARQVSYEHRESRRRRRMITIYVLGVALVALRVGAPLVTAWHAK